MRFFTFLSRFTFICNIAFLLYVFFQQKEIHTHVSASGDKIFKLPYLEGTIIVLGFSAIFINLLMNIFYLIFLFNGKIVRIPKWLVIVNFLFLVIQIFYSFFYQSK